MIAILVGEALLLRSVPHAWWAAIFAGINLVYIPLVEEPKLRDRFGEAYREYRRNVHRIIPRISPWIGDRDSESDKGIR
ncbi:MAG: methyltransferase family protein [Gemmatimonadales bacterium]